MLLGSKSLCWFGCGVDAGALGAGGAAGVTTVPNWPGADSLASSRASSSLISGLGWLCMGWIIFLPAMVTPLPFVLGASVVGVGLTSCVLAGSLLRLSTAWSRAAS